MTLTNIYLINLNEQTNRLKPSRSSKDFDAPTDVNIISSGEGEYDEEEEEEEDDDDDDDDDELLEDHDEYNYESSSESSNNEFVYETQVESPPRKTTMKLKKVSEQDKMFAKFTKQHTMRERGKARENSNRDKLLPAKKAFIKGKLYPTRPLPAELEIGASGADTRGSLSSTTIKRDRQTNNFQKVTIDNTNSQLTW